MKKSLLLLTLGILGVCQLGYSDINTEIEKNQTEDTKQIQEKVNPDETENEGLESKQTSETEKTTQTTEQVQKKAPKTKKLTPEQERRLEAKARKNKEKNMTLDEKLDLQILKMERMLKSLEGK